LEFLPCVILGASDPRLAHRALKADLRIGLLPCNVVLCYEEGGSCVVAAVDPVAALSGPVRKWALERIAAQVQSDPDGALKAPGKG